jgi:circadian clock protein KaiC
VRRELFNIVAAMKDMNLTAVITAERVDEYGEIARFGVEEFVTDNVIILRNALESEKRRRTIEILKFRGTNHRKGEFPFTIMPGKGVIVIPLSEIQLEQKSAQTRTTSGNKILDTMCGGGLFRDSILLLSGATGCGKTLLTTEYVAALGEGKDERSMLFAFEESRDQLFRNASGWGQDFRKMEDEGRLKVIAAYPETAGLEDHLIMIRDHIDAFKPTRIAVDSLSALERVSSLKGYREFVIGITSYLKEKQITGLFTSTTSSLMGGESITEQHISTITDSIILLRYVEMFGEMKRGLTVLKMRGSRHDKDIREFSIDEKGMHIGNAFKNVTGILSGHPRHVPTHEVNRLTGLFPGDPDTTE